MKGLESEKTLHQFQLPPIITSKYTDPDTKIEMAIVIFPLYPDIKNIEFELVEEGDDQFLLVKFGWPENMHNSKTMFSKGGKMTLSNLHPKVMAVEKALKSIRQNIEDVPVGITKIHLAEKVKNEPKLWEKEYIKQDSGSVSVFISLPLAGDDYATSNMERMLHIE